jgi:hypothetical protein
MLHEGPDGERMGWASMETRMVIRRLPRLGDQIQSFSAVIGLADKTSHRIQWAYDVDRGDLLTTFEVVNLAFDTGGRRPMTIPPRLRAAEQSVLHQDLAPRSAPAGARPDPDERSIVAAVVAPVLAASTSAHDAHPEPHQGSEDGRHDRVQPQRPGEAEEQEVEPHVFRVLQDEEQQHHGTDQ